MADRGLRLQVDTQELNHEDEAELMSLRHGTGIFVFSASEIKEEDMLDLPKVKTRGEGKTKAQRLRAVLYLLWQRTDMKETSDEFYDKYMEKLIEKIKEKL